MTQTTPLQTTPMNPEPHDASTPPVQTSAPAKRKTLKLPDNALTATIGTLLGVLLVLAFNQTGARITDTNDRLTDTNDRLTRLEDKVVAGFTRIDERFAAQDAKFDERFAAQDAKFEARFAAQDAKFEARFAAQDAKLDEINLKLTTLIAALNATAEVEAAVDGRLLDPDNPPDDGAAN